MTRKATAVAIALAACSEPLPDDVANYQTSCMKLNDAPIAPYDRDPHRGWKNVYACGVDDDRRPFADGTLIVKESTRAEAAPWLIATARKQHATWRWDEYTRNFADESFRRTLASQSTCTECHQRAKAADFIFTRRSTTPSPTPDAGAADDRGLDAGRADASAENDAGAADARPASPTSQVPPQERAALQRWLATGAYKMWHCEARVMDPRPNGAHGRNRVCSNEAVATHGDDRDPFPVGAASVKELYGSDDAAPTGYAVAVKVKPGDSGDDWYWSEGGLEGVGVSICVGCHAQAPRFGGRDFVYVLVR